MNGKIKKLSIILISLIMIFSFAIPCLGETSASSENGLEPFYGKKIGVLADSVYDIYAENLIPGCQLDYTSSVADCAALLTAGKVDAYVSDEAIAAKIIEQNPEEQISAVLTESKYSFAFPKSVDSSKQLCSKLNDFILTIKESGELELIEKIWFGNDESAKIIDFDSLKPANGTLRLAVSTAAGDPFVFVKDNQYVGYDIDIAYRFCKRNGYGLEVINSDWSGMLANIAAEKCDFAASCIIVTDERKQAMLFSKADYEGEVVLVTSKDTSAVEDDKSFWESIKESFEKTFIREGRYNMFLRGIKATLIITIVSAIFGTVFGIGLYLIYRLNFKIFNTIVNLFTDFLGRLPVLVVLMILYYIIFGHTAVTGMWVSLIGFTILFGSNVFGIIKPGVEAVNKGQAEAAISLGYTEFGGFIRFVFPQAVQGSMSSYKSALISLIKDTAVVGYISVQDLTQIGDIIRSRTYEAFFPLIATALIYCLLTILLTLVVNAIDFSTNKRKKKNWIKKINNINVRRDGKDD